MKCLLDGEAYDLIPRCPFADLFGKKGRAWLAEQKLRSDELCAIEQRLREIDRHGEDLAVIDRALAQATLNDARVRRLLTISGVNVTVAISQVCVATGGVMRREFRRQLRMPEVMVLGY